MDSNFLIWIIVMIIGLTSVVSFITAVEVRERIENKAMEEAHRIYYTELRHEKEKVLEDFKASHTLSELVEGIGGVQTITLSPKTYIELLKAKEELTELKLSLKGVLDDN